MNTIKYIVLLLGIVAVSFSACKKDDSNDDNNGNGNPPTGSMSLKVGGKSWTANFGVTVVKMGDVTSVTGTGDGKSCNISMYQLNGTGTFPIGGQTVNSNVATWSEGTGSENIYVATFQQGGGSITITELTSTRISGTFNFVAKNDQNYERDITEGSFVAYF